MMIGIEGSQITKEEKDFITQNNIGGISLFSRNIENAEQVAELTKEIQELRIHTANKAPLFIAVDMEGGRVSRLKDILNPYPAIQNLGQIDSALLSYKYAESMGRELMALGFNIDFAPCVDILTNEKNELIGDRALGDNEKIVGKHASALIRGYLNSGIIACAKHFPGHGNTIIDSHEDLPIEEATWDELEKREIQAFKKAFRARVDLVMTAHILFKNIDPDYPVTLSKKFLTDLLAETGYKKLIITDDLDMKALTNHYDKKFIPVQALKAGAHILLYCNEKDSPHIAIEEISKAVEKGEISLDVITNNYNKVVKLKADKVKQIGPLSSEERKEVLNSKEHQEVVAAVTSHNVPDDLSS